VNNVDKLINFITARLDEDERTTIAARDGHPGPCLNYPDQEPEWYTEWDSCCLHIATAKASRYRDTAFGLRAVQAGRWLIDQWREASRFYDAHMTAPAGEMSGLWTALRLLAWSWSDHADYDASWSVAQMFDPSPSVPDNATD